MGRVMRGVYYAERGLSGTFTTSKTRPRADTGRPCESRLAHLLVSSAPAALAAGAAGAAAAPARVALLVLRVSVLLFFRHRARFEGARVRSVERARASNARGRGRDASPRRDEILSVCPYATLRALFTKKCAGESSHF